MKIYLTTLFFITCFGFVTLEAQLKALPDVCTFFSEKDIQGIFSVDAEKVTLSSNTRLERSNRKKCIATWDKPFSKASIYVDMKLNSKKDEHPNRYSNDIEGYKLEGISLPATTGLKMKFESVDSLGTEAIYSDNMGNDRAIIFHLNNNYIISIHYQEHIDMDIGDYKDRLVKLGEKIVANLKSKEEKAKH
jgi:hypothetical protein